MSFKFDRSIISHFKLTVERFLQVTQFQKRDQSDAELRNVARSFVAAIVASAMASIIQEEYDKKPRGAVGDSSAASAVQV